MDLLAKEKLLVRIYSPGFLLGRNHPICRILLGFGYSISSCSEIIQVSLHSGFHPSHGRINIVGANRVNVADQVKTTKFVEQCADIANSSATSA